MQDIKYMAYNWSGTLVGDTSMDVEMALNLRCPIIALTFGRRTNYKLKNLCL